jgi:hypothetical protein
MGQVTVVQLIELTVAHCFGVIMSKRSFSMLTSDVQHNCLDVIMIFEAASDRLFV